MRPAPPSPPPGKAGPIRFCTLLCYRSGMEEANPLNGAGEAGEAGEAGPAWAYTCPSCGTSISLHDAPAGGLIECPACRAQFFAASADDAEDEAEADRRACEEAEERLHSETEFNENRIKQFKTLRRGLIRTRNYFVIGAAGCLGVAAELLWDAWPMAKAVWQAKAAGKGVSLGACAWPLSLLFATVAACLGCGYFIGRVRQANRELAVPLQTDPVAPPDFSTLSDGSHQWRGLEQMAGGTDEPRA